MVTKQKRKKQKKYENPVDTLLSTLKRIERKLDFSVVLRKSMPAFLLCIFGLFGSTLYISLIATIPDVPELPTTGDEQTEAFVIIYPEHQAMITLPDSIIGIMIQGSDIKEVTFWARTSHTRDDILIGKAELNSEGYYEALWEDAPSGMYSIWALLTYPDTSTLSTTPLSIVVE